MKISENLQLLWLNRFQPKIFSLIQSILSSFVTSNIAHSNFSNRLWKYLRFCNGKFRVFASTPFSFLSFFLFFWLLLLSNSRSARWNRENAKYVHLNLLFQTLYATHACKMNIISEITLQIFLVLFFPLFSAITCSFNPILNKKRALNA